MRPALLLTLLGAVQTTPLSSSPTLSKRLPSAIVIGVKKGGTRALLEFLRLHPDIAAPGPEIHFFDRYYDRGLDWYRSQMPPTREGMQTVEKTPSYFITKEAPLRIKAMNPHTKLLLVVRDPVTRAISDYAQTSSKRSGMPSFSAMAFRNDSGRSVNASWGGVRIGLYHRHLRRWIKAFPRSQIHFVSGEGLISDPSGEMSGVESFLGLSPFIRPSHFSFSPVKGFPCIRTPEGPHCLGRTKGRPHPTVSEEDQEKLRTFFEPENRKFYKLARRDFGWSKSNL